ncbi:MAG: glycosyltransferase family 39 protein [Candidatus Daviesbacteria bacterium]
MEKSLYQLLISVFKDRRFNFINTPKESFLLTLMLFILAIIPFLLVTKVLFLKEPLIWPDEALFVDVAHNLLRNGVMGSSLLGDLMEGYMSYAYWTPPLIYYFLAFWMGIFGEEIEVIRMLPFIFSILTLFLLFLISKKLFNSYFLAFLSVLLVSLNYSFSNITRVARMEIFTFFFILASLWTFLLAYEKKRVVFLFISGLCIGFAILSHPLGAIAIPIIVFSLLLEKISLKTKLKNICYLFIPLFSLLSLWLLSMKDSFNYFLTQYQQQLIRKDIQIPNVFIFFNNDSAWRILFLCYLFLFILLLIQFLRLRKFSHFFILIGLVVSSIILTYGKEIWYFAYFQPFIALASVVLVKDLIKKISFSSFATLITTCIIVFINLNLTFNDIKNAGTKEKDYHQFVNLIKSNLPKESSVFLTCAPDPYFDLRKEKGLTLYEFPPILVSEESYKALLNSVDFIVFNMIVELDPVPVLGNYINNNTSETISIDQPSGYRAKIFKLVPKDKRI